MRVAVLGSGVIGTAIAWYAARAGQEVTVIDRQPDPALETSFANAGEVSLGYSITLPIDDAAHAPESTIMDETHKVAVTRLGDRIRVGGTAELAGYSLKLRDTPRATLEHVVTDLFPRGGDERARRSGADCDR